MIHVYTGEGKGKTTAAFGLALRMVGAGRRAVVVQFLKGRQDVGEFQAQKKFAGLEVRQFGRADFVNPMKPEPIDFELAREGLKFAERLVKEKPPGLLVLDEANVAMHYGLLSTKEVLEFIQTVPPTTELVFTGRNAPKEIIARADLVTEMKEVSHPYRKGVGARKGVEY